MIDRELQRLGVDSKKIAEGVSYALRREPIIIAMIIGIVGTFAFDMWMTAQQDDKRLALLAPLVKECLNKDRQPCIPQPCIPQARIPQLSPLDLGAAISP